MKITQITSQNRNDFCADMECEGCGMNYHLTSGYNDGYYHQSVIPNMKCNGCGKSRIEIKAESVEV